MRLRSNDRCMSAAGEGYSLGIFWCSTLSLMLVHVGSTRTIAHFGYWAEVTLSARCKSTYDAGNNLPLIVPGSA